MKPSSVRIRLSCRCANAVSDVPIFTFFPEMFPVLVLVTITSRFSLIGDCFGLRLLGQVDGVPKSLGWYGRKLELKIHKGES